MSAAPPASTRARGRASEDLAASFLEARGLVICGRNITLAHAELDLVGRIVGHDGAPDTVVFVEIRSRKDDRAGDPAETVDRSKQRRVVRAATAWLLREELWERVAVRFDVLTILFGDDKAPEITWIPGAFEVDG
ncbi:MAG: YraN family protein [Nannocystis sp.]|nr:YraN family protein [Nannocystis sp.]MBA3548316.1 YraN family protein [Nannocystis sp.]